MTEPEAAGGPAPRAARTRQAGKAWPRTACRAATKAPRAASAAGEGESRARRASVSATAGPPGALRRWMAGERRASEEPRRARTSAKEARRGEAMALSQSRREGSLTRGPAGCRRALDRLTRQALPLVSLTTDPSPSGARQRHPSSDIRYIGVSPPTPLGAARVQRGRGAPLLPARPTQALSAWAETLRHNPCHLCPSPLAASRAHA